MGLRPGSRFETSSHFMPLPRSSIIIASSSGDHLVCFLTGWSWPWVDMPLLCVELTRDSGRAAVGNDWACSSGPACRGAGCSSCWAVCGSCGIFDRTVDSFESSRLSREAISRVNVVPERFAADEVLDLCLRDEYLETPPKLMPVPALIL